MHRPPALPDDSRTLRWPFFDDAHRQLRAALQQWASTHLQDVSHEAEHVDATCVDLVQRLGADGWLRHAIAGTAYGASHEVIDTRSLCLLRETLAWHHGLADFAFAMQGLGSGAISLFGTPAQKAQYLPRVAKGEAIFVNGREIRVCSVISFCIGALGGFTAVLRGLTTALPWASGRALAPAIRCTTSPVPRKDRSSALHAGASTPLLNAVRNAAFPITA